HVLRGLPALNVTSILYDPDGRRLLATAGGTHGIFESSNGGQDWKRLGKPYWQVRSLNVTHGRLLALTAFDGVIMAESERLSSEQLAADSASSN
ncbi:MAG: hypothetical protein ACRD2R_07135, partial [Terriglobales bacterium]